jgi:hypothetical protein
MRTADLNDIIKHPTQIESLALSGDSVRLMRNGSMIAVLVSMSPPSTSSAETASTGRAKTSLLSPPPPSQSGAILKPSNSRAEMLDNFFDRDS